MNCPLGEDRQNQMTHDGRNSFDGGVSFAHSNGGVAVPHFQEQEPPGWRELCAKLRTEKIRRSSGPW
jgi:hypothetical protein